ncbi:hypothetical protein F5B19DRAFT_504490 [Rostrohypoxylon terebratum]|nr:hypothetical protein F5B19DRAFT_504490 [Rostrohypoxylon terebratum]
MRPWQRFSSAQRRTPGQQFPPFTPPEPRDHSPGATSYLTSEFSELPDPPRTPHQHSSHHHHHHPNPHYRPVYEPDFGPAYGPPRLSPNHPGFARRRDGALTPINNDMANPPRNPRYHGNYPPGLEDPGSFGQYLPPLPGYLPLCGPPPPLPNYGPYYPEPSLPPPPPGFYWAQAPPCQPPLPPHYPPNYPSSPHRHPPPLYHSPPPYHSPPHHHHPHHYYPLPPPPPPPPPRPPSRPPSRSSPRAYRHLPHWPPTLLPLSARTNPRGTPLPINQTPIPLHSRPEHHTFLSEAELRQRLTPLYRPLVGVIGRLVQTHLSLPTQPRVKFDLYPVQVLSASASASPPPSIRWRTLSRAPIYSITLPGPVAPSPRHLQALSDALRDALAGYPNAWYRQAGFVFRTSRRAPLLPRGRERVRFWVPPLCVYRYSRRGGVYEALFVEVSEEAVEEVDAFHDYGDTSEDDQEALVDEMWADVRMRNSRGV